KHIRLKIPYSYYGKYLTTDKRIQVTALCEVLHTRGVKLLVEKTIILEDTNIIIKLPRRIVVNKSVTLEISYANPLPEPVSRCVLLVTLMNQQVKINLARLAARERSKIYFEFTPRRPGPLQLQVDFSCDKFSHVKGFVTIAVAPA
ncbi:TGM3 glutamyltransferase, partial [Atlantisia rogersi]|nr:TGM3 glutamyltransferase [Atlantisia rogersi]